MKWLNENATDLVAADLFKIAAWFAAIAELYPEMFQGDEHNDLYVFVHSKRNVAIGIKSITARDEEYFEPPHVLESLREMMVRLPSFGAGENEADAGDVRYFWELYDLVGDTAHERMEFASEKAKAKVKLAS